VGAAGNRISGNDFFYNGKYGFYLYQGNDPPEPDDNDPVTAARPRQNSFLENFVQHYGPEAIKVDSGDANEFTVNQFVGTNATLRFITATDNAVINNSFPSNVVVKMAGSTAKRTTTLIKGEPLVTLQLDQFSTAQFEDDHGAIFDSALRRLTTVVETNGSFALVTLADLGALTGTVFARDLQVVPNMGEVLVTPQVWSVSRHVRVSWTAQTSNPAATVHYTVGGLSPSVSYAVTDGRESGRGNGRGIRVETLGTYMANTQGDLIFAMQHGTTANLTYSVADR
jgi:hypothetical protein